MSIWFEAIVALSYEHTDTSKNPVRSIKAMFKKHGMDFNQKHTEGWVKQIGRNGIVQISICNPDGFVDIIHESLKDIKKFPFVSSISIIRHYY